MPETLSFPVCNGYCGSSVKSKNISVVYYKRSLRFASFFSLDVSFSRYK